MLALILAFEIVIAASIASILLGTVMPLLVAVVTKSKASRALKFGCLLTLSVITGMLTTAIGGDGNAVISDTALVSALIAWVTGMASYYGLWKPSGVAGSVAKKTDRFGIGKEE